MELLLWALVFTASLVLIVKGADWFLESAEKIGLAVGLSSFVVGVVLVGLGTSLPELTSSLAAVLQGASELVAANVVGSNIANILLIIGISAVVGGKLAVSKNLVDLDIPLLTIGTTFGVVVMFDGIVTATEAVFLLLAFVIFLTHSIRNGNEADDKNEVVRELFASGTQSAGENGDKREKADIKLTVRDFLWLAIGLGALVLGGRYLFQSVLHISEILMIGVGVISLVAVAVGTSLPELAVSVRATLKGKYEVALGNIFGSNAFNILFVLGLPALFMPLVVDPLTLSIGIPTMVVATIFFVFSGLSRRIHSYEGALYLLIYAFFIGKLFGLL